MRIDVFQEGSKIRPRIGIIDDSPDFRATLAETVGDADYEPIVVADPFPNADVLAERLRDSRVDAVICDYHLTGGAYAPINGAQVVGKILRLGIPSILCTRYSHSDEALFRSYREYIPVICQPGDINLSDDPRAVLDQYFFVTKAEMRANPVPERRPFRTLLVVEDLPGRAEQDGHVDFRIPAWRLDSILSLSRVEMPPQIQEALAAGKTHFHAHVNIGAPREADIFIVAGSWEDE